MKKLTDFFNSKLKIDLMKASRQALLPAIIVLSVSIFVVVLLLFSSINNSREQEEQRVQNETRKISDTITDRMTIYQEVLYSTSAIFKYNREVSKQDFSNYIKATGVIERYPGFQGIGFAKVFDKSEKAKVTAELKQQVEKNFSIIPDTDKATYSAVIFLEPMTERNQRVIGFDMLSETNRRNAMLRAAAENRVIISDTVSPAINPSHANEAAFLMYLPVFTDYTKEKPNQLEGYVYGGFRAENLFSETFKSYEGKNAGFQLFSKDPSTGDSQTLYESKEFSSLHQKSSVRLSTTEFNLPGTKWYVEYAYLPSSNPGSNSGLNPSSVIIFGGFATILLASVTYLVLLNKNRQDLLAKEKEINEAKDNLLSIASHQLRTPATGVKQYIGMVIQGFMGDITENQRKMLEKAYESNERQLETINEVLYLARLDSGRIVITPEKFFLRDELKSVIEELKKDSEESGHKITLKLPKNKFYVYADRHIIRMVIENLITNAIKYTPNGGKININLSKKNSTAILAVKDTGVGIKPADMEKLFKEFSRIPNELSKSVSGTGIGLYLSMRFAELHGGKIDVQSEPNKGSTFTLILPTNNKGSKKFYTNT